MTATWNRTEPPVEPPGPDAVPTRPGGEPGQPRAGGKIGRSRMGGVWVALIVAAFVLLLLLIFILQNGQEAQVSFLGAHGSLPMGVALLLAAVFGVLLVALPGTARIIQLRVLGRRAGSTPTADPPVIAQHRGPTGR
jgi:uncharacterized integral membrane protein